MLTFGTDGVRGLANVDLSPEYVLALGRAAARVLGGDHWLVGRDPRRSGTLLEAALVAGLTAEGADVELLGVVPTPAVAHVAKAHGCPGAMISASHNPFSDNGVKLFAPGGTKLPDAVEAELVDTMRSIHDGDPDRSEVVGAEVGAVTIGRADVASYRDHLLATLEGRRLDGMTVVVDASHGAASDLVRPVCEATGATIHVVHAEPDGLNINDGVGSTEPELLSKLVLEHRADVGLALDGDADRVIAVDETGAVVDGDHLIALCALEMRDRGDLNDDTVVVTVMSNLGFRIAMEQAGIGVVETPVGDRYVLEALDEGGFNLGGEQSGHVIFRDLATTGDGMLTGLRLLDLIHRADRPFSELAAAAMTRLPQVLHNVAVNDRSPDVLRAIAADVTEAERELGDTGRVLIRPSGTEPLIRVMVEAADAEQAERVADRLVAAVAAADRG